MRIAAGILILVSLTAARSEQIPNPAPKDEVRVRTLTLVTDELPQADRKLVVNSLRNQAYSPGEFEELVRLQLRNLGYAYARVEDAELTSVREQNKDKSADVSVKVEPGAQYRLGSIRFKGATLFPPEQLRSQFPLQTGSFFCATSVQRGLERLRTLYEEKGYINFGAIPKTEADDAHHIIDLVVDMDEGSKFVFGHLVLDGIEPHAGDGQALVASWSNVQGKTYNPELLQNWLASNWPGGKEALNRMKALQETEPHQVNIRLQFP
jgi:outer membrane translocation and assembly module TamA